MTTERPLNAIKLIIESRIDQTPLLGGHGEVLRGFESAKKGLTISLPGRLVFDIMTIRFLECPFTQKNNLPVPLQSKYVDYTAESHSILPS